MKTEIVILFSHHSKMIIIIITPCKFFTPVLTDGFHWGLVDSKSPQFSRTLLIILIFSSAVV